MSDSEDCRKILLVPIATLGCGKTTVGNGLNILYGSRMGHIQNDEIPQSKTKKRKFVEGTKELLALHTIVVMDRNNAEKRERAQIFADISLPQSQILFVALNFLPKGPNRHSRRATRRLVSSRSNHLMIRDMPESKVDMIMANCEKRFEPLDVTTDPDSNFHATIDLAPGDSLRNMKTIVAQLDKLGVPSHFTKEEIAAAYEAALKYEPKLVKIGEPEATAPEAVADHNTGK